METSEPAKLRIDRGVVLIDLDDTLISDTVAVRRAVRHILKLIDAPDTSEGEEGVLAITRTLWRQTACQQSPLLIGVSSWEALWTNFLDAGLPAEAALEGVQFQDKVWAKVLEEMSTSDIQLEPSQLSDRFHEYRRSTIAPLPGAVELLRKLYGDHELWLVSHGSSTLQREKLAMADLAGWFSGVFISGEIGSLKTSREFLGLMNRELAARDLTVRCVIGDGSSDMQLATNGNWPGIHVCRHDDPSCRDVTPEFQHVTSLLAIESLCEAQAHPTVNDSPGQSCI